VPGLVSAEFFTRAGLDILVPHAGLAPPLPGPAAAYLLLEASGPGAFGDLADVIGEREAAVGESAADRARLWSYRERHPEAAGFLGVPVKLDVSVPAAQWVRLASEAAAVVTDVDPGAEVITFGHVADGNVHVNIVPAGVADGRHEDAVFSLVASLGGPSPPSTASAPSRHPGFGWRAPTRNARCSPGSAPRSTRPPR
jgi:FAD/FMN-containing dehydrogenase